MIPYLLPGHYYGIEPERWKVEDGIDHELGRDAIRIKEAKFAYRDDFKLSVLRAAVRLPAGAVDLLPRHPGSDPHLPLGSGSGRWSVGSAPDFPGPADSDEKQWSHLVRYRPDFLRSIAEEFGLAMEEKDWSHPTQKWVVFTPQAASSSNSSS